MKILSLFRNKRLAWDPDTFPLPWDTGRPSIYRFIKDNGDDAELPDKAIYFSKTEISWVGGAVDHVVQPDSGPARAKAWGIYSALKAALARPSADSLKLLYDTMTQHAAIEYIDSLAGFSAWELDSGKLQDLMRWLASNAPDREVVKAAIALLGSKRNPENIGLFRSFSRHDEFALFANVALTNTLDDPEMEIWEVAKHLNGWGKIDAVSRLSNTKNPDIKSWLLRHGCANSIMHEYLAYTCATAGNLIEALSAETIDEELLSGASDIIDALFAGGPAEDMFDYPDGAEAVRLFVSHMGRDGLSLAQCAALVRIAEFLAVEESDWDRQPGWSPQARQAILHHVSAILQRQPLAALADPWLLTDDHFRFYHAITLARHLDMDIWQIYLNRQLAGHNSWYFLMRTDDPERIDRVLDLARSQLAFDDVATGPQLEIIGHGKKYETHAAFDYIVQDLRRFPGKGWDFVEASLQSPLIRNRNMALKALEAWGRQNWPVDAEARLSAACEIEPHPDVKAAIGRLLAGQDIRREDG
ncbi:hypothetical protein [Rhizobium aouanii]|uniref:Limonene hydroxylase n=1 Tax=Rhizobium aouanii TaxID=3118145 RepID=A0ABU8CM90_9HYPH